MTTVYGVTFIGAKNQIQRQLKDRGDIPAENLYMCSLYLGRLVLDSIGDIFKGATGIQTWLNRCARLISKSIPPARIEAAMQAEKSNPRSKKSMMSGLSRIPKEQMTSVAWTTPLGLPVVQPYRKAKKRQVRLSLTSPIDQSLHELIPLFGSSRSRQRFKPSSSPIPPFLPRLTLERKLLPSLPTLSTLSTRLT